MPHPNPLSLAGRLDNGASRLICTLLSGLKKTLLWLCGLLVLALLPFIIFEYGEGLADMSVLEWGFLLLLSLLTWRHVNYCKHFSTGLWQGVSRLLIVQGLLFTIELMIIGLAAIFLWQTEYEYLLQHYLRIDDPISKLVTYFTILIALYLSAPTAARTTKTLLKAQADINASSGSLSSESPAPVMSNTLKEPTL